MGNLTQGSSLKGHVNSLRGHGQSLCSAVDHGERFQVNVPSCALPAACKSRLHLSPTQIFQKPVPLPGQGVPARYKCSEPIQQGEKYRPTYDNYSSSSFTHFSWSSYKVCTSF